MLITLVHNNTKIRVPEVFSVEATSRTLRLASNLGIKLFPLTSFESEPDMPHEHAAILSDAPCTSPGLE